MRWLCWRLLVVSLFLTMLIGVSFLMGHLQPTPERTAMLHLDDCLLPCWIGIVLEQTTIDEAKAAIYHVYSQQPKTYVVESLPSDTFEIWSEARGKLMTIDLMSNGDGKSVVTYLRIDLNGHVPTLGEIYRYLPQIPYVDLGGNWEIRFPTWSVQGIDISKKCFDKNMPMRDPIVVFTLGDPNQNQGLIGSWRKWAGFRACYR